MEYRYETEQRSYEDYASGRVLLNAQGTTAFPVRLASEIYQQGKAYLAGKGRTGGLMLYDPCCGGAHLLTSIGIRHGGDLSRIIGTDIDQRVLEVARRNLSMVNADGMMQRLAQLRELAQAYDKASHKEAVVSAERLLTLIEQRGHVIEVQCDGYDTVSPTSSSEMLDKLNGKVDFVFTDVPYGDIVQWSEAEDGDNVDPIAKMLGNLVPRLAPISVIAIVADKKQKVEHPAYRRLKKLKVGKRQVVFLELEA
jgi:RRNA methyltransferase AviRa.